MRQIVFDVETSGISSARGGRVIEIGAVSIAGGRLDAEFASLIDVDCAIHWGAARVHGITRGMLRGQPRPREVWPAFLDFIGDASLIAHNASFDVGFMRCELGRLGMAVNNPVLCSLRASRRRFPCLPSHRLEAVARHVLGEIPADCRLHRALGDARLLARVWLAMGAHIGQGGHAGPPLREP